LLLFTYPFLNKINQLVKPNTEILNSGIQTIKNEAEAIANLLNFLTNDFAEAVKIIYNAPGRVIVTGIGKSANIAQKIVATLNSTGTPAIFMHAADAIHGDLGMVQKGDVVLAISNSGNTPEIKVLMPLIKLRGNILIAITGNENSFLAEQADFLLLSKVEKEACPNNLAPTSSTTSQLVLGDALAVALLEYRQFSSEDFAKYHPGGSLGKKLYLRVSDIISGSEKPEVLLSDPIEKVIVEMTSKRLGATAVLDEHGNAKGIITDGDLRRMLVAGKKAAELTAKDIMGTSPKTIESHELAANAFSIMEKNSITQLIVLKNGLYEGMIHIHDILREGIA
jgi:arabinose-5-phosphate isomerase